MGRSMRPCRGPGWAMDQTRGGAQASVATAVVNQPRSHGIGWQMGTMIVL